MRAPISGSLGEEGGVGDQLPTPLPKAYKTNVYTECNRRNVRDFGRVFLMLNYTDITQNTYIQS